MRQAVARFGFGITPPEFAGKAHMGHAPYGLEQAVHKGQYFETGLFQ